MDRHYLMVRAMTSQAIHFRTFFDNDVVAVGWSDIDFTKFTDEHVLKEAIRDYYYSGKSNAHVSLNLNECIRFKNIVSGDYVIIPYYSGIALTMDESKNIFIKVNSESFTIEKNCRFIKADEIYKLLDYNRGDIKVITKKH